MNKEKTKNTAINDPVILEFKKTLVEKFSTDVTNVFLYGSRAHGDFEQESDYDVIVLVNKISKNLEDQICTMAWEFGFERG
ncbi:MAG: nucleotidyltransferase domain-containing protein [Nitrospirae bacterium]|nr:nucleotidyltransferase domain-containing protein [Nitrospirota bacterium]MBI3351484.1 nucleotidyltransferase domain-containing protein [Nitrospirota bacterium]